MTRWSVSTARQRATVGAMRKLIVQQWVTVDNIAAEEDGGLSFVSGEPFSEDDHQPRSRQA